MPTNPTTPEAAERARFEAWAGREGHTLRRNSVNANLYSDCFTNEAWRAWQAALAAQEGGGERVTDSVVAALRWYAEHTEGCRKIGSAGDPFRNALDADGGKRARDALRAAQEGTGNG